MKNERAFSRAGFYKFVLDANLMLHNNVAEAGRQVLSQWLFRKEKSSAISILDLACGGAPVSICRMTEFFISYQFEYTGIDINPDQIDSARSFSYPTNYRSVQLQEGNAWDFVPLTGGARFDIIFSGMNIHHGTPGELFVLLRQIREALAPGGIFLSHDFFRPASFAYLKRPDFDPVSGEPFAMMPHETLNKEDLRNVPELATADASIDWRQPFIARYRVALTDKGAASEGVEEIMNHVQSRDYPVSIAELQQIALLADLPMQEVQLNSQQEPMRGFFCMMCSEF